MLTLAHTFQRFLAQPTFAARTRESYAEDLAPLMRTLGEAPISALTSHVATDFLAAQEHLAASTYNRRFAALRSFVRWLQNQSFIESDPLEGLRRLPLRPLPSRALNAEHVEAMLRIIQDTRDRALFWLLYEGGLRVNEALSLNIEDIDWTERSIRLHDKGDRLREMFFSRDVSKLLAKYLKTRGDPTSGPLFVTHRKARAPATLISRLMAMHASRTDRLIHSGSSIRPTGISTSFGIRRSVSALPIAIPKSISSDLADTSLSAAWSATSLTIVKQPNAKLVSGNVDSVRVNIKKERPLCRPSLRPPIHVSSLQ